MGQDMRWKQRFGNFQQAVRKLRFFADHEQKNDDEIAQVALIGGFEFTFELGWKTIKDYLNFGGIQVSLPRDIIKQGFHHQIISDGETWIAMLEDRNMLSHVYDEGKAKAAIANIHETYIAAIMQVHDLLHSKL